MKLSHCLFHSGVNLHVKSWILRKFIFGVSSIATDKKISAEWAHTRTPLKCHGNIFAERFHGKSFKLIIITQTAHFEWNRELRPIWIFSIVLSFPSLSPSPSHLMNGGVFFMHRNETKATVAHTHTITTTNFCIQSVLLFTIFYHICCQSLALEISNAK